MFTPNNKSDIVRHLSNLRMNTYPFRRDSTINETLYLNPSELQETPASLLDEADSRTSADQPFTDFGPMDSNSYPPEFLHPGIEMMRVTRRKIVKRLFKLDISDFSLRWNAKETSKLFTDKIKSIRIGDDAKNYREQFNISHEFHDNWITIIYVSSNSKSNNFTLSNDLKALHMIAPTKKNFEIMTQTLTYLYDWSINKESLMTCIDISEFSAIKWNNKIREKEFLTFNELIRVCAELHIYIDQSYVKYYFDQCCSNGNNCLNFEEFQNLVAMLRERSEFSSIFLQLGITNEKMNKAKFKYFLKEIQMEEIDDGAISSLFEKFSFNRNNQFMKPNDLANYLSSKYTSPYIAEDSEDENYYSLPLTDYFISSSHNTYLLGKQVHGNSSIEGYIHALQRGCRCIEIDIWNNSNAANGNPLVTHGHTLTSSIDLKLVADTIRKYAFIASPFPIIISLEIKCSVVTQLKTVEIMKSTFGDMLIYESIDNNAKLPSPNDLKYKVLLKVKKSNFTTYQEPNMAKIYPYFSTTSSTLSDSTDDSGSFNKIIKRSSKPLITPELTLLAPYLVGVKFRNFSLPESKTFNHVFSFSDRTLMTMMRDEAKKVAILKHNRRGIVRVYPSVLRYKSDNFNPIMFWNMGCQMVATNWQLWDCGEELSESFFRSTGLSSGVGYSGYRRKPEHMRLIRFKQDKNDLKTELLRNLEFDIENFIDITIISGQQLPKPKDCILDYTPWVEVKFYNLKPKHGELVHVKNLVGIAANGTVNCDVDISDQQSTAEAEVQDERRKFGIVKLKNVDQYSTDPHHDAVFKTGCAENSNNLFKPSWNLSCRLKYLTSINDLSFVRIIVKSSNNSKSNMIKRVGNVVVKSPSDCIIGSWCCRISDLKSGFRHIRLVDNRGDELTYSTLFIKVTKQK